MHYFTLGKYLQKYLNLKYLQEDLDLSSMISD